MFEGEPGGESLRGASDLAPGDASGAAELCAAVVDGLRAAADDALVEVIWAAERLAAWAMAQQARGIARLAASPSMKTIADPRLESLDDSLVRCEVASCLRLTQDQARMRILIASALDGRLPGTLAALTSGALDWNRARLIVETAVPIGDHAEEQALSAGDSPEAAERAAADLCGRS